MARRGEKGKGVGILFGETLCFAKTLKKRLDAVFGKNLRSSPPLWEIL